MKKPRPAEQPNGAQETLKCDGGYTEGVPPPM